MTIINLYTHKGNMADLTEVQQSRFTEIEVWLLWKKLRLVTHYTNHTQALHFLQGVINSDNSLDFTVINKLTGYLTQSEILVPSYDEVIVYLRFQGLGLNKVTKATGRQHQYLHDLLSEFDTSTIIPTLTYDFKFIDHPELMDNIYNVTHKLFHVHLEDFYEGINLRRLDKIAKDKFLR